MTDKAPLGCTNAGCAEVATRIIAKRSHQVRCLYVAPYCDEHAEVAADLGGVPAAGPALSEQAQEIEGIR